MSNPIFYYPDITDTIQLTPQESAHCVKVLRMKEQDRVTLTDGKGYFFHGSLLQANPRECVVTIDEREEHPNPWSYNIEIAFAPTKSIDRTEWFVEKSTEIGIDVFHPIRCKYSERKDIRKDRIEKISVAAMKQSQKAVLPLFSDMISFVEFIIKPFDGQKFIAHCQDGEKSNLAKIYSQGESALILIGPEGDFSPEEVAMAIEHGFMPISLGESRLRTETAALVACHTLHILNSCL